MLKLKSDLHTFNLTETDLCSLNERTVVVTKWNWEYSLAHAFQKEAVSLVQETPHLRILICCSHPEVFTNGRGLQRPKKGEDLGLVEFNFSEHTHLPFPLHQVERGGGLTFHHPGQFVFYPIVKLNPSRLSLSRMIEEMFDLSIEILNDWGIRDLHHEQKLLGLWHENKKLASMGIAVEKLTTYHGMALNVCENKAMKDALTRLNPCGLNSSTYTSVEALHTLPEQPLELFRQQFLKRIEHEWK